MLGAPATLKKTNLELHSRPTNELSLSFSSDGTSFPCYANVVQSVKHRSGVSPYVCVFF